MCLKEGMKDPPFAIQTHRQGTCRPKTLTASKVNWCAVLGQGCTSWGQKSGPVRSKSPNQECSLMINAPDTHLPSCLLHSCTHAQTDCTKLTHTRTQTGTIRQTDRHAYTETHTHTVTGWLDITNVACLRVRDTRNCLRCIQYK